MAYCVRCGVKLEEGAAFCPLCHTKVILPAGMEECAKGPLFPEPLPESGHSGMGKTGKGILEGVWFALAVAELSLAVSLWVGGILDKGFLPLFILPMSGLLLAVGILAKHVYTVQATLYALVTALLLFGIDIADGVCSWSWIANGAIGMYWMLGVLPFFPVIKGHRILPGLCMASSPLLYLLALDILFSGTLDWFVPVALPVVGASYLGLAGIGLWIGKHEGPRFPLADVLFMFVAVVCYTLCIADLVTGHYRLGSWAITWSSSLLVVAAIITLFLCLVSVSKAVRRFFTSQYR